jgi:hypothetical protein
VDFYRITEINTDTFYKVFKKALRPAFIAIVIVLAVQIVIVWAYFNFEMRNIKVIVPIISMFCIVFIYRGLYELFRKLKRSNWLLAISDDAIYVKFRSCFYEHLGKLDKQIISIKPSEIEAFRKVSIVDVIATGRSKSRIKNTYLEIIIRGSLAFLQKALANEHKDYGLGKTIKSRIEISCLDFPVIVSQENTIRINITEIPGKNDLIAELKNVGIKELEASDKVFSFFNIMNKKDMLSADVAKQRIVELLKEGRRLDARNAIQYYYLIDRKQTNSMMEQLLQECGLK